MISCNGRNRCRNRGNLSWIMNVIYQINLQYYNEARRSLPHLPPRMMMMMMMMTTTMMMMMKRMMMMKKKKKKKKKRNFCFSSFRSPSSFSPSLTPSSSFSHHAMLACTYSECLHPVCIYKKLARVSRMKEIELEEKKNTLLVQLFMNKKLQSKLTLQQ